MNKKLVAGIILLVLVLSACQLLKNTTTAEPTTPTLTQISETATNTRRPTKTATAIPPTATADIRATQTQYSFSVFQDEMDTFPFQCADPNPHYSMLSPTKSWLAIQCGSTENQTLEILNKSGQRWILRFSDYLPDEFTDMGNVFLGGLIPIYWSTSEKFVYFVSYIHLDGGGGPCFYGIGFPGLFRIDITNGNVSTILPFTSKTNFYSISISPDGKWLAYGIDKPNLLNLETGEKLGINIKGNFGNLTWSPDSSKLAFATCQSVKDVDSVDESAIKYFEMDSRVLQTIIEEKNRFFVIYTSDNQKMEILSQDSVNYADIVEYFYDWSSETLTQIMLTPTPLQ